MVSTPVLVSALPVAGVTQTPTCNVKQAVALNSSSRLGIACPSAARLRACSMPLKRASKQPHPSLVVECKTVESDAIILDKEDSRVTKEDTTLSLTPSTLQVQTLLEEICDDTRIAELKLKVGAFSLHLKRDVGKVKGAPVPLSPVASVMRSPPAPVVIVPAPAPPVKSNSLASSILPATISKTASLFGLLEAAADQGLSFVTSPKVGVFRRGRNVKGKIGKPLVDEGAIIKEGQVVGYLEQLGTQQPVEAKVSGEVVQVLWEDGESVGYGDPLISIRPSFPGIVSRAALN